MYIQRSMLNTIFFPLIFSSLSPHTHSIILLVHMNDNLSNTRGFCNIPIEMFQFYILIFSISMHTAENHPLILSNPHLCFLSITLAHVSLLIISNKSHMYTTWYLFYMYTSSTSEWQAMR